MDVAKIIDDLGLKRDEVFALREMLSINYIKPITEEKIRENFKIIRNFKKWQKRHPEDFPLLREFNPVDAEVQLEAILIWWWRYCDVRKKNSDPSEKDLFPEFQKYK